VQNPAIADVADISSVLADEERRGVFQLRRGERGYLSSTGIVQVDGSSYPHSLPILPSLLDLQTCCSTQLSLTIALHARSDGLSAASLLAATVDSVFDRSPHKHKKREAVEIDGMI
jgi:hypothetical protein